MKKLAQVPVKLKIKEKEWNVTSHIFYAETKISEEEIAKIKLTKEQELKIFYNKRNA